MYCSDETLKDHANKSISRSETALTITTSFKTQWFDELKPTPQEGPVDIQQDLVLPGDSSIFASTIPERSSETSKSIISNVEIQQLSSPSEKPQERITGPCKITLPDSTLVTKTGNIVLTRNQSPDLQNLEARKVLSNFLLCETPPEKSSLIWSEEESVEQPTFGRSSKKTDTKVHKEFMPTTPTPGDITNIQTFSRDQHLSVESKQNLSHVYKKQSETLSDSFRKSSNSIVISSHEEVPSSDPTTVTKTMDIYLNQSQILLNEEQAQQSPKETAISQERIKPQLDVKPQYEGEDTTKILNKSFMKSFTQGKGEICIKTSVNLFNANKHTPHEESQEGQQDQELPRNILPFKSESMSEAKVRGIDIKQKSLSFRKPSERLTDPLQMTLHDPTVYKNIDTLLSKDQAHGPVVEQDQKLLSDSMIFESTLKKSSIVREFNIQKPLTLPQRSSKNIAISTHEDVRAPYISACFTGILSADDQTQLVVEAKQDHGLPHSFIVDVRGDKPQSIIVGAHDEVIISGPSTTIIPSESIATKPGLDKTTIITSSKELSLPKTPDTLVQRGNTKCQMTEVQTEAQDMDRTKFLSKTSTFKPYSLESQDNVVTKLSLQTQSFSDDKHVLHEYPLESQYDQNLQSQASLFEFTPKRSSLRSVELQQQSVVSEKPNERLVHSAENTLPDTHTNVANILLARDQPQSLEAQQDKSSPSDLFIFQTPLEKSVTLPTKVDELVRGAENKLPLTLSSTSKEMISIEAHEDISLTNPTVLSDVPVISSESEQIHLLIEAEQDANKKHICLISDLTVGQVPELITPLGKSSKSIVSSHEEFYSSDSSMFNKNKEAFLSRNLNQEQTQTLGLSFSTSSIDRVSLIARNADVPVQRESTTSLVEENTDVDIKSSSKQIRPEKEGVILESSEFTKKPSLQTQRFDYHKHTGHDYPQNNEPDQKLASNIPVLKLTNKISSGTSKSVVVNVDVQKKSSPSGKPSEKNDSSFEVTSANSTVHTMAPGIILSQDHHVLENLPSYSLLSEKTFEQPSAIWSDSVTDAKIHQSSTSSHHPRESIIDPHNVGLPLELTRNQAHVPLEHKVQMLSNDALSKSAPPSLDYPETSDTSSKTLKTTNTVQCTVEFPAMLLTSPNDEGEETSFEESSVSQCECVTQKLNNLNVKTNEVAKFFCCIKPETIFNNVWYHNNKKLATTERIKFEQSGSILSLLIYDIQPEDQGIYSCVVTHKDYKTQTSSAQLNIEGGYLPCNHLIPNHHLRSIHIISCPDDLS